MDFTIFYAWQSDREAALCRNFIEEALKEAVRKLNEQNPSAHFGLDLAPEIQLLQGSAGEPGAPSIPDTISQRIERCDVFVSDLTFVTDYTAAGGKIKRIPNGNVLLETGFAAFSGRKWERMILVMNKKFGGPESLPFDVSPRECKVVYELSDATSAEAPIQQAKLSKQLVEAIEPIYRDTLRNRAIRSLEEMRAVIPPEWVPSDGNWGGPQIARANVQFAKQIVGRRAEIEIQPDKVTRPNEGRYRDMAQVLAQMPVDNCWQMNVLFYAYYPVAQFSALERDRALPLEVRGVVSRCDIDVHEKTGATQFNIDVHTERY